MGLQPHKPKPGFPIILFVFPILTVSFRKTGWLKRHLLTSTVPKTQKTSYRANFLRDTYLKINPDIPAFPDPGKKINFLLLSNLLRICKLAQTPPRENTGR
jgi:hypothetical protein